MRGTRWTPRSLELKTRISAKFLELKRHLKMISWRLLLLKHELIAIAILSRVPRVLGESRQRLISNLK